MKTRLVLIAAVAFLAVWCAVPAMADNIQLSCPTCTSGGTSLISPGTTVAFSFIDVANETFTGDSFIAILVPTGDPAPTLTGFTVEGGSGVSFTSGTLGGALGDALSYQFSSIQSASEQVIPKPPGYTAYEFDLGTQTLGPKGAGVSGLSATAALGSVIVGFIECGASCPQSKDGTLQTPLSESITIPEPSSLGLLALGLVGLLGLSKAWPRLAVRGV